MPAITRSMWSRRLLKYAAIPVAVLLALYALWAAFNGPRGPDIVAAILLVAFVAWMLSLRRTELRADQDIAQRIKTEFPAEAQVELFEIYNRLKSKELELLFQKVLDEAHGNLAEARKLAGLAEGLGWKAFLENRW